MYFIKQRHATRAFNLLEKIANKTGKKERVKLVAAKVLHSLEKGEDDIKKAAEELVLYYNDYTLVRDRLCAAYARNIKTDSYGKSDDRKVDLAFQKIAKQEGLQLSLIHI